MSQRDPDSAATIYVILFVATVALCLLGAFVLPSSISLNKQIGIVALVGFFAGIPVLNRFAHRSRIRAAVEELAGSVVQIKRLLFWKQIWQQKPYLRLSGVRFEVDYWDASGLLHHALCYSSWYIGVEWLDDKITV
jgi:hypothetical protein